jgi:hypothetical protein
MTMAEQLAANVERMAAKKAKREIAAVPVRDPNVPMSFSE